jgi:hypothetical protein
MSTRTDEILRRRTFAIISHPDAGKTTLTDKLLLFGGAIQLAGEVRARGVHDQVVGPVRCSGLDEPLRLLPRNAFPGADGQPAGTLGAALCRGRAC